MSDQSATESPSERPAIPKGRLLDAREIARDLFGGSVGVEWVKRNVAPDRKLRLGHSTVRWWEHDVLSWIERKRSAA
jgi:predicted DNA-binding transcriptional regulator AlpA